MVVFCDGEIKIRHVDEFKYAGNALTDDESCQRNPMIYKNKEIHLPKI